MLEKHNNASKLLNWKNELGFRYRCARTYSPDGEKYSWIHYLDTARNLILLTDVNFIK